MCFQTSGIGDGIKDVSGKPADLFRDDQLKFTFMGIADHAVELGSFLCRCAGNSLVCINFVQLPLGMLHDVLTKISLLRSEGIELIIMTGGNSAVSCYVNVRHPVGARGFPPPVEAAYH